MVVIVLLVVVVVVGDNAVAESTVAVPFVLVVIPADVAAIMGYKGF